MSTRWATALVAATFLSLGTMIGTMIAPQSIEAAKPLDKLIAPRIAYVNIAKVLWRYKKAAHEGGLITAKKQQYAAAIRPLRDALAAKNQAIPSAADNEKLKLQKEVKALERQISDLTQESERVLSDMSDRTVVDIYGRIRDVIGAIAKERGLDVVECYPDGSKPEDEKKPAMAQVKLQTPALIPFYLNKEFDLTDQVIETLNKQDPVRTDSGPGKEGVR